MASNTILITINEKIQEYTQALPTQDPFAKAYRDVLGRLLEDKDRIFHNSSLCKVLRGFNGRLYSFPTSRRSSYRMLLLRVHGEGRVRTLEHFHVLWFGHHRDYDSFLHDQEVFAGILQFADDFLDTYEDVSHAVDSQVSPKKMMCILKNMNKWTSNLVIYSSLSVHSVNESQYLECITQDRICNPSYFLNKAILAALNRNNQSRMII